ncbi:MAG: DNA-binding protein [Deltaproteobacteria bacterium]|nr:DNA-binding protein [Deltaproteobacteria bacterium]
MTELIEEVGATDWFWRTQIWSGKLPFIQIGKKIFVDGTDVDQLIKSNKHTHLHNDN